MILEVTGELAGLRIALWLEVLLNTAIKGSLLAVVALLLSRLLRGTHPLGRSRVWTAFFLLLIGLLPAIIRTAATGGSEAAGWTWRPEGPVLTVVQEAAGPLPAAPAVAVAEGLAGGGGDRSPGTPTAAVRKRPDAWSPWLLLWPGVSILLIVRLSRRLLLGRGIAARSRSAPDSVAARETKRLCALLGVTGRVRVGFSDEVRIPFATGLRASRLILPSRLADWDAERLRPILLHELAHVGRRDLLRLIVGELACALYWFQPLVWLAARRSRLDQELACDALVCRFGVRAVDYARTLLCFIVVQPGDESRLQAVGLARATDLESRLAFILGRGRKGVVRRTTLPATLSALAVSAAIAATSLVESVDSGPPGADAAASVGFSEIVGGERVVTKAPVDKDIRSAVMDGDLAVVRELIALDPGRLDTRDDRGMTPLALAAWHDRPTLVRALLDMGADPDIRNRNGLTPLFCALDRGRLATARILIEGGAEVSSLGYNRRTLLHMAARAGDGWSLDHLLDRGADINAVDVEGATPLDLAVWSSKTSLAERMASLGAKRSGLPDPYRILRKSAKSVLTGAAIVR